MGKLLGYLTIGVILSVGCFAGSLWMMEQHIDPIWFVFICEHNLVPFICMIPIVVCSYKAIKKEKK